MERVEASQSRLKQYGNDVVKIYPCCGKGGSISVEIETFHIFPRNIAFNVERVEASQSRLKLLHSLQWHFFLKRMGEVRLGNSSKQVARSDELAAPEQLAPTRQWSVPGPGPDAGCSCGCGDADGHARPREGHATNDER